MGYSEYTVNELNKNTKDIILKFFEQYDFVFFHCCHVKSMFKDVYGSK